MSQTFKDCILSNVQKGMLDQSDAEKLVKDYDELLQKNSDVAAIEKLERNLAQDQIKKRANVLRHMKKRDQFFSKMNERKTVGEKARFVSEQLQASRDMGESTHKVMLSVFNDATKELNLERISEASFRDAAIHVIDGTVSKDASVQAVAEGLRKVFRFAKNESDTFGLIFGDLGERYFPRFYDKAQFSKMPDDDFINLAREHVQLKGLSDDEAREVLLTFKRDVETDGLYSASQPETLAEAAQGKRGGRDLQTKRNKSRELSFKSGNDYIEFTKKLGGTDLTIMEHFNKYLFGVSQDLGVAKTLGPMPRSLIDETELRLNAEMKGSKKKNAGAALSTRQVRGEFETLMGTAFTGDSDNVWFKRFQASQYWMRACHLGSAVVSAISDTTMSAMTLKLNGGKFLQPITDYASTFQQFFGGKSAAREITEELGYIIEGFNGMMIGDTRFTLGEGGKGIAKRMSDIVFKASGLDAWTKNGRAIAQANAIESIARVVDGKSKWADLPDYLKMNLEQNSIGEADWADVLKYASITELNGRPVLQTNSLRVNKDVGYARGADLADKIDATVIRIKNLAINENSLKTDAWTSGANFSGDGKVSGLGKAGSSAFFQYKSYAISVLNNHLVPAMRRASQGVAEGKLSKLDHLAMLMIGTTVAAAIPLQLKEIIKGRNPKAMNTSDFWLASTLQGGGMGILGDFLFKDFSRRENNFMATLAGPYASTVQDIYKVVSGTAWGVVDGDEDAKKLMSARERRSREAWKVLKRNIPANNLWYTRLLTERLIFDNVERIIDPKFDKRMRTLEKKLTKERDGAKPYWWRPGGSPEPETMIANKTARR